MIDIDAFIRQHTELMAVPLVPEINLYLAHEAIPIWQKTEEQLVEVGLPPPYWAFAWAGGQALARYVLDHPEIVSGKTVLDLASGSGLVAIAASKAGAKSVLAADIDAFSISAIAANAAANGVHIKTTKENLLLAPPQPFDAILVGDLFYERSVATACFDYLQKSDAKVLIGDPGRSYLPTDKLLKITEYAVPVSRDLEDAEIKRTAIWAIA